MPDNSKGSGSIPTLRNKSLIEEKKIDISQVKNDIDPNNRKQKNIRI